MSLFVLLVGAFCFKHVYTLICFEGSPVTLRQALQGNLTLVKVSKPYHCGVHALFHEAPQAIVELNFYVDRDDRYQIRKYPTCLWKAVVRQQSQYLRKLETPRYNEQHIDCHCNEKDYCNTLDLMRQYLDHQSHVGNQLIVDIAEIKAEMNKKKSFRNTLLPYFILIFGGSASFATIIAFYVYTWKEGFYHAFGDDGQEIVKIE